MTPILLALLIAAAPAGNVYPLRIVRVVDGDTIRADLDLGFGVKLYNAEIRMADYDAWESSKITRHGVKVTDAEVAKGKLAGEALERILTHSTQVVLSPDAKNERDKYGRVLGRVSFDGKSVATYMVQQNHSRDVDAQGKKR